MTGPDPFEDRLRETLRSSDSTSARTDVDAFLSDVHRGARSRRRRRVAGAAAAAVLAVAGGGAAVGSLGVFQGNDTPVADDTTTPTAVGGTDTTPTSHITTSGTAPAVTYSQETSDVLSLTSTGDDHQWALVGTDAGDCAGHETCATVFARDAGGSWAPLSVLPVPANTSTADNPFAVAQVRFAASGEGGYNGWTFDGGLVSTHDSGLSWQVVRSRELGVANAGDAIGNVHDLEARGGTAYALMTAGEATDVLITSSADADDWHAVDTGAALTNTHDLNVTEGVVAFLSDTDTGTEVLSSPADPETGRATGDWTASQPCASGSEPVSLSSASDTLWALCSDGNGDTVAFRASGADGWTEVPSYRTGAGSLLTARSTDSAVLHLADNTALMLVTAGGAEPLTQGSPGFSDPTMLGFTNSDLGFAIADGVLWRSGDGGATWAKEHVLPD
jgi:hypothetical protein